MQVCAVGGQQQHSRRRRQQLGIDRILLGDRIFGRSQPYSRVHFGVRFPKLQWTLFRFPRQRFDTGLRNEQSMFELRRSFPITRCGGPSVRPAER